ncbi:MAG: 3-phosphoglycerate dehydrogenase [Muribaculaceae bacterium]|nr:3-phosphoglycerate dehydrogenase [Muribaculaceae bacterium]
MKVLIATEKPFAPVAVDGIRQVLEQAGHKVALLEKGSHDDLVAAVHDVTGLIVRSDKVTKDVFDAAPLLKVVVRAGAGYDNIDLDEATAHGVCVMNTPGQNANAVAELVMGMLVTLVRNRYDGTSGTELLGKTLGIHAYGAVGRNVARIAKGFGMKVSALDPFVADEVMEADGIQPVHSVEQLYADNQIVSLHIPANDQTRRSVTERLLTSMPKGAILVNAARKEVIDEPGLQAAMAARSDLRYIADVKPDIADELQQLYPARVLFTPKKMGAQTAEANINAGLAAARQIVDHLATGWNRFQVNK